jgi:hypothetical protein
MAKKKANKAPDTRAEIEEMIKATRARLDSLDRILIETKRLDKSKQKPTATKKLATSKTPQLFSRVAMACVACAALAVGLIAGIVLH